IPAYFGVTAELAGKSVGVSSGLHYATAASTNKNGGLLKVYSSFTGVAWPTLLASARWPRSADRLLQLDAYLSDPAAFYARPRAHTVWFGLLIAASAGPALAGLLTAWRAFQRQVRLREMKTNFVSSASHELRAPLDSL